MHRKKGIAARLASLALALTLVVSGIAPALVLVAATPQQALAKIAVKASSLKVNKKTVKKNKKLTFTVNITGNPTDVQLNLQPKTGAFQSVSVRLKKVSGNKYKGTVKVTNAWNKGKWIVGSIWCYNANTEEDVQVYNKALGVPKSEKRANLNGGNFKVKGTKGDKAAPKVTVKDLKFGSPNEYGERKVSIKATDNRAGVQFVDLYYVGPGGEELYGFLDKKSGTKMTGLIYSYGHPKGTYKLKRIVAVDKVGNSVTLLDSRFKSEKKKNYPYAKVASLKAGDLTL